MYMKTLTKDVEGKIRDKLPDKFALAFDCLIEGTTHYVSIFASIPTANTVKSQIGYKTFLLGC